MFLTKENLEQIAEYLKYYGIKDTEFQEVTDVSGTDYIALIHDNKNVKTTLLKFYGVLTDNNNKASLLLPDVIISDDLGNEVSFNTFQELLLYIITGYGSTVNVLSVEDLQKLTIQRHVGRLIFVKDTLLYYTLTPELKWKAANLEGIIRASSILDPKLLNVRVGNIVYLEDSKVLTFINNENTLLDLSHTTPIYTTALKLLVDSLGITTGNYINIGNPTLVGSPSTNTININSNSGDYLLIMFSAIRALQSEIARIKNTFYYGIQSLNEGYTTSSAIINSTEEEKEALWAIDPEDLSEVTESCIDINSDCQLIPSLNWQYDSSTNYINIIDNTNTPTLDLSEIEFDEGPAAKVLCYAIIDPNDNWNFNINFANGKTLKLQDIGGISKLRMNIMFILSRRITDEDTEISTGKNYYYINVTNSNNDKILTTYLDSNLNTVNSEPSLEESAMINTISLKNVKLYKLKFYTKQLAFSNDGDLIPEKAITDNFVYKASHLTVRTVSSYLFMNNIASRLLPGEPILCLDSDESLAGLYFKRNTNNSFIKIGASGQGGSSTETGMTQQEMITWLTDNNLIAPTQDGYNLNIDISQIDPNQLQFSGINIVNEDTLESFNIKVDYKGNIYTQPTITSITAISDSGSTKDDNSERYGARGAAAKYSFGSSTALDTTTGTEVSQVTIDADNNIVTKALGDRIRFGSWYIPNNGQTVFNCSHDFIEIVNSGTFNYPLKDAKLGIIYRNQVAQATGENLYGKHYSIKEFALTDAIAAGGSYLIRGKSRCSLKTARIKITEYDTQIDFDFVTNQCVGLLLFHKNLSGHLIVDDNGTTILRPLMRTKTGSENANFTYYVDMRLLDAITFNGAHSNLKTLSTGGASLYTNASYTKTNDCIGKDLYSLDPARQGFRSLSLAKYESTQCRLEKIAGEEIPLNSDYVTFPHSNIKTPVLKYTPKASRLSKNVLTDKTSPDFDKPNMVTCSFGINAATTRCFNWFSMSEDDEFVWIRKQGTSDWTRFESYKEGDGTANIVNDANTSIHRKEFTKAIVNSIYKRIDGVFPGDSTYKYRAHKCVVYIQAPMSTGNPVTYEYIVGKQSNLQLPKDGKSSDIQTFTIYPLDYTPKVYQTTDQQGFGWMEYLEWSAAAQELNSRINTECTTATKLFPVFINTGDMTQNGTRVNEWLDYYNGGKCIFNHIEQHNVVGNNDLCNSYSVSSLGNGDDDGKTSPYYFHVFYCYEVPNETINIDNWTHSLIYNGVYVPSMYYFYFNKYGYLMVNSELTPTTCYRYYKQYTTGSVYYNLYTGGASNSTTQLTELKNGYLAKTLNSWIDKLITLGVQAKNIIVACHEMPFTVTTQVNLLSDKIGVDRSISGSSLVGSHLNVLGTDAAWKTYDYTYWFSTMLLNKGIKLCIGGHKHTYAVTYPVADLTNGNSNTKTINNYHFSKKSKLKRSTPTTFDTIDNGLWDYDNTITNGVVYFMCLATGYKQKSNKELPTRTLAYSKIVPETTNWKADGTATADVSQTYPMYATFSYDNDAIHANLYRVINIKKESISNNKAVVTEFSETQYSTNTMYSEQLVITPDSNVYANYWVVPSEYKSVCSGIVDNAVIDKQRCIHQYGLNYTTVGKTITADSNYTIDITL